MVRVYNERRLKKIDLFFKNLIFKIYFFSERFSIFSIFIYFKKNNLMEGHYFFSHFKKKE